MRARCIILALGHMVKDAVTTSLQEALTARAGDIPAVLE